MMDVGPVTFPAYKSASSAARGDVNPVAERLRQIERDSVAERLRELDHDRWQDTKRRFGVYR
jgi:phage head maturation protease